MSNTAHNAGRNAAAEGDTGTMRCVFGYIAFCGCNSLGEKKEA